MNAFGDIRAILQRGASEANWEALCDVLVGQFGEVRLGEEGALLDYCTEHLKSWPEDLPTFAPRSWFQMSAETLRERALTPFFVFCFVERTPIFIEEARRELTRVSPDPPPPHLDLDQLGDMRWRWGEHFDEGLKKRFIALLAERCVNAERVDVFLVRLRQLLNDEDIERWTIFLLEHTRARVPNDPFSTYPWAFFQFGTFAARYQFGFGAAELSVDGTYDWRNMMWYSPEKAARAFGLLDLFDQEDTSATLCRLALDTGVDFPHRGVARETLGRKIAREQWPSTQHFLRCATTYDTPTRDALREAAEETKYALKRHDRVLTRAMIERTQVPPVTWLFEVTRDLEHVCELAIGWIIFALDGERSFQLTSRGPMDARGDLVEWRDATYVTIAHPIDLARAGELEIWCETFTAQGLIAHSVQLTREVYTRATPKLPEKGIAILHRHRHSYFKLELWQNESEELDQRRSILHTLFDKPGYDWWLYLEVRDCLPAEDNEEDDEHGASIERVVVRSKLGAHMPPRDDDIIHSEVCRIMRVIERAATYGEVDSEELLP